MPQSDSLSAFDGNSQPIVLLPNAYKDFLRQLTGVFTFILLPLLASYIMVINLTSLSGATLGLSMAGITLLLTLGYILWNQKRSRPCEQVLTITEEGISLACEQLPTLTTSWDKVETEMLGWGPEQDCMLPALRISIPGRKPFTVGATDCDKKWENINRSIEATDFVIESQSEWKRLIVSSSSIG